MPADRVETRPIRVIVGHPHALLRRGLASALGREDAIEVVGEADSTRLLIGSCARLAPDVALLDLELRGVRLPDTLREIQNAAPGCRTIVLAMEDDHEALLHVVKHEAGYLTHGYTAPSLAHAIRAIRRGELVFPRSMLRRTLKRILQDHEDRERAIRKVSALSEREREVLKLLTDGANNEGIAEVLVVSPQTARTHIQNILVKMNLHSRLEAVAYVRKHHLAPELARHRALGR